MKYFSQNFVSSDTELSYSRDVWKGTKCCCCLKNKTQVRYLIGCCTKWYWLQHIQNEYMWQVQANIKVK